MNTSIITVEAANAPHSTHADEEGSSLMSTDCPVEYRQFKSTLNNTSSPTTEEKLSHGSTSTLKSRINESLFRTNVKRQHLFTLFKWTLIFVNALMIFSLLSGISMYFSDLHSGPIQTSFQLAQVEQDTFSSEFSTQLDPLKKGISTGPKYAWVITMITFGLLLTIPCIGFIGAIKENTCLLIFYGAIFVVNAFVILTFKSFWCLIPAVLATAAFGLVYLIPKTIEIASYETNGNQSNVKQSKYSPIVWNVNPV